MTYLLLLETIRIPTFWSFLVYNYTLHLSKIILKLYRYFQEKEFNVYTKWNTLYTHCIAKHRIYFSSISK